MVNLARLSATVLLLASAVTAVTGTNLAIAQQSSNSTSSNSTTGSTNSTSGNTTSNSTSSSTPAATPTSTNTTSTDISGTCTVEQSGYHYCYNTDSARQIGIGIVAGVVALSVGLGAAGLRYRYPGT
jgi:hypothetical protein